MKKYGLIGKNLSHSFSPDYFNQKFQRLGIKAEYKLFEIESADEFPEIIKNNPELAGLNVTIPYKRSLRQFLNIYDDGAEVTGSVNTIKFSRKKGNTLLEGFNTDIIGFEKTIRPLIKRKTHPRALILGTGGSANTIAFVLRKLGVLFTFVSRNPSKIMHTRYSYIDKEDIDTNKLIINTTPLGMFPNVDESPDIPYEYLTKDHILYDLIYNPKETVFIKKGREIGATCVNGEEMLKIQAEASWKIWNKGLNF